jgi:hypothetical protein
VLMFWRRSALPRLFDLLFGVDELGLRTKRRVYLRFAGTCRSYPIGSA